MSKITTMKNYKLFIKECRFFYCKELYGSEWSGIEKFIISSDIPENKLQEKYPEILKILSPYIYCNKECGDILLDSLRNEDKYKKRAFNELSIDDEYGDIYWSLKSSVDIEKETVTKIMIDTALESLTPIQRDRIMEYFVEGLTLSQIGNGRNHKSVSESIKSGLMRMKKFLK